MPLEIRPDHLRIVMDILHRRVPGRDVWVFGSRAQGKARQASDLDLAILGDGALAFEELALLRDEFSESNLPYKVDVVDWNTTSAEFRAIIEAQHIPLVAAAEGARIRSHSP